MVPVIDVLTSLAKKRPIFHSEADFQHAFAWEIHQRLPHASIRLERPIPIRPSPLHLDVWVKDKGRVSVSELKYKTRALRFEVGGEPFALKDQSAQDLYRYDFIKDVQRLERVVAHEKNTVGYAVLLTNDSAYWAGQTQRPTVDANFRLYEGRVLRGTLQWGAGAAEGTKRGREESLKLRGKYTVNWKEYPPAPEMSDRRYGRFRYLVIEIVKNQGAR